MRLTELERLKEKLILRLILVIASNPKGAVSFN
jgi:hypothetical protein